MTEKTLDERIAELEESIRKNPYSSTIEKEQLEELKRERGQPSNDGVKL